MESSLSIQINPKSNLITLSNINYGDTFEYNGIIYIKASTNIEGTARYLKLTGGKTDDDFVIFDFDGLNDQTLVKKLNATLTIDKVIDSDSILLDAKAKVEAALQTFEVNNTTKLDNIKNYVVLAISNNSIEVIIHDFKNTNSTATEKGNIYCVVHLNLKDSNSSCSIIFDKEINEIEDSALVAFNKAVECANYFITSYPVSDGTTAELIKNYITNKLSNDKLSVTEIRVDNFVKVEKGNSTLGAIKCSIYIRNESTAIENKVYDKTITVERIIK